MDWSTSTAVGEFTCLDGRIIKFRRLTKLDICDLPHHLPILNQAVYLYTRGLDEDKRTEDQVEFMRTYERHLRAMAEDATEAAELIVRACVEPKFYNHKKQPPADGALPLYEITEQDIGRLVEAIMWKSSGIDKLIERSQAQRLASFPGESDGAAVLEDGEADGATG